MMSSLNTLKWFYANVDNAIVKEIDNVDTLELVNEGFTTIYRGEIYKLTVKNATNDLSQLPTSVSGLTGSAALKHAYHNTQHVPNTVIYTQLSGFDSDMEEDTISYGLLIFCPKYKTLLKCEIVMPKKVEDRQGNITITNEVFSPRLKDVDVQIKRYVHHCREQWGKEISQYIERTVTQKSHRLNLSATEKSRLAKLYQSLSSRNGVKVIIRDYVKEELH